MADDLRSLRKWWTREIGGTIAQAHGKNSHDEWRTPSGRIAASTSTSTRGRSDPNYRRMVSGQLRRALRAEKVST